MSVQVGISIGSIPVQRFNISVRENGSTTPAYLCTGSRPTWVLDLLSNGASVSLSTLTFQAGRHFSDRVNAKVVLGSSTKRLKAAALAWALISMVNPYIENGLLWVENPNDPDIKRLCSEILGVGAGLNLLASCGVAPESSHPWRLKNPPSIG